MELEIFEARKPVGVLLLWKEKILLKREKKKQTKKKKTEKVR